MMLVSWSCGLPCQKPSDGLPGTAFGISISCTTSHEAFSGKTQNSMYVSAAVYYTLCPRSFSPNLGCFSYPYLVHTLGSFINLRIGREQPEIDTHDQILFSGLSKGIISPSRAPHSVLPHQDINAVIAREGEANPRAVFLIPDCFADPYTIASFINLKSVEIAAYGDEPTPMTQFNFRLTHGEIISLPRVKHSILPPRNMQTSGFD